MLSGKQVVAGDVNSAVLTDMVERGIHGLYGRQ